jgi:hypothetical protein
MSKEKQFVGKVTARDTQYGEMISISFGENDRKLLEETKNDKGWNNLTLKKSQKGGYYLEVYEGNSQAGNRNAPPPPPTQSGANSGSSSHQHHSSAQGAGTGDVADDLPF